VSRKEDVEVIAVGCSSVVLNPVVAQRFQRRQVSRWYPSVPMFARPERGVNAESRLRPNTAVMELKSGLAAISGLHSASTSAASCLEMAPSLVPRSGSVSP